MRSLIVSADADSINQNNRHFDVVNISFDYQREARELFRFLDGEEIPLSLFVRADQQVEDGFGDIGFVHSMLQEVATPNVRSFWHFHSYDDGRPWRDVAGLCRDVRRFHPRARELFGGNKAVRIGSGQGGGLLMATLQELGYEIDSSALPGLLRQDEHRHYDWLTTPQHPYFPSKDDYRSPGASPLSILELPLTTIPFKASYDLHPKLRQLNPCYRPEIFQAAVDDHSFEDVVIVSFHVEEMVSGYRDDLFLYGLNNFRRNFDYLRASIKGHIPRHVDELT